MTNDELQFAIDYALDNVIKTEDCIIKTANEVITPQSQNSVLGILSNHLVKLIDIQACRAAIETSTCCKDGDKKA